MSVGENTGPVEVERQETAAGAFIEVRDTEADEQLAFIPEAEAVLIGKAAGMHTDQELADLANKMKVKVRSPDVAEEWNRAVQQCVDLVYEVTDHD